MDKGMGRLHVSRVFAGRYRIVGVLGQGGMGAVYLAEDLKLRGKRWAIKESLTFQANGQQCIDEMTMLIQLNHPYLPTVVDYYPPDDAGYSYVVMDYIQGETLLQLFEAKGKQLPVASILKYSVQLCDVLCYLHQFEPTPIIYRDLKPANIMIDAQDHVSLIDFGIARNFKLGQHADTMPMGTIGFAAPEQFADDYQTDHRTDLFNLGAMMYYLLSKGRYYYVTKESLGTISEDVPYGLVQVIDKLLMTRPEDRYQSSVQLKKDLEALSSPKKGVQFDGSSSVRLSQHKTIVIGSLYSGAGSTFVSIALARVLDFYGLAHAVLEHPTIEPKLYTLLYGEEMMPKDYNFLMDVLQLTGSHRREWQSGKTTWFPLNPQQPKQAEWNEDQSLRLLYATKYPVTIIDVSTQWLDESVVKLCSEADDIVFVADALPGQFNSKLAQLNIDFACQMKAKGKSVNFIANRMITSFTPKAWLRSFPWSPLCKLPNIAYQDMMQAVWKHRLVQDTPMVHAQMEQSLQPLIKHIVPHDILLQKNKIKKKG